MVLRDTSHALSQLKTSGDGQAGAWNHLQVPLLHTARCSVSSNGGSVNEFCLVGYSGPERG